MRGTRVLKIGFITIAALAVLVIAAVLVLRSSRFHRFVLAEAIQKAQKATGGRVEIGNFAFHWRRLHVDLYNVALYGTEPASAPPLLQADRIGVTLKLISIWEHKANLQEIVVDHPVVHYLVDASGRSNLPHAPARHPGSNPVNVFNLAIGHFIVNRGELYDNDREAPLQAELLGVQAQVAYAPQKREYDGQLSYRDGRIQYGRYNPVQHDLYVQFAAAPSALAIKSLRLASGSSVFTAQGHLQDYANPTVEASYQADLSMSELSKIINNKALPSGAIATQGVLHYGNDTNRPFLERISVEGRLSSPSMMVLSPEARAGIHSVSGAYSLDQGNFEARNVRMDVLGGHIAAQGSVRNLAGREEGSLEASLQGISLQALNAALTSAPLDASGLSGRMDGTVSASWLGHLSNLQARADASITAFQPVQRGIAASSSAIPVNGAVHAAYEGRSSTISLHDTYFRTPHSALRLEGTLAKQSLLQIQAQSNDLHEIDVLAISLRRRASGQRRTPAPRLLGLGGSASFNGQLQGSTKAPRLTGQFEGENISYEGTSLPSIRASLAASPAGLAIHQGQLRISSQGRMQFDANLGLADWSFTPQEPIRVQLTASGVPLQDIQHLANRQYPVSGIISANLAVQGSENSPSGTGVIRLSSGSAWGQPIQNLSVQFQGDGNSIRSTIRLQATAGAGNARLTFQPRTERYDLQGDFLGIRIEKLQLAQIRKLQISGIVNVTAQAQGTIQSPELTAVIIAPKLQIRQQNLDGLQVRAGVASQQAAFTVSSSVSGTAIQGQGTVQLIPPYDATAHIDTGTIQLAPVLGSILQQPAAAFRGQMALHAFLHGPLKYPTQIQATLSVPYLSVGYQSLDLASSAPITADYRYGTVTLPGADFKGTAMNLHVEGAVPLLSNGSMHASAVGNMDLRIIQAALPGWSTSGQLHLNLRAQGTRQHPQFYGTAQITNATLVSPQAPLGVQKLNADFDIEQERISIRSLTAQSGGGTITGQGFVTYQPPRFNLAVSAKDVRLSYPQGVRTVLESNLTLIGSPRSAVLAGQVLLDRVSVDKDFNVASLMDQFSGPSSPPGAGIAQNIQLNVAVRSTRQMDVSTSQLSIEGAVALQVRGTLATPLILGRTEISSGDVFFNGNRFQVENGVIQFDNPTRTEPVLNLDVTTTINEYTVSVRFAGPLDHMRTTYTSDPPLAPVDVINLLVTGHPSEASSSNPNTPESVVAGQLASQVSGRVERLAGISSLTIDPQIGGSGTNAGTRLAIQQRVTKNLFFTFATNISSTEDPLIQVEYQATKRFSVSALRDQNGNYSLEIGMHKRF